MVMPHRPGLIVALNRDRIRWLLAARGFTTYSAVAEVVGCTRQTASNLLRGGSPSRRTVEKLVEVLRAHPVQEAYAMLLDPPPAVVEPPTLPATTESRRLALPEPPRREVYLHPDEVDLESVEWRSVIREASEEQWTEAVSNGRRFTRRWRDLFERIERNAHVDLGSRHGDLCRRIREIVEFDDR